MRIAVLMTCFNRKGKTENCICSLSQSNSKADLSFIVVDDGSRDGTSEMLSRLKADVKLTICSSQNLYYSGGMRLAMKKAKQMPPCDYVLLVNDDVAFYQGSIDRLIEISKYRNNAVIVGATCSDNGEYTYGAIKYLKGINYRNIRIDEPELECDTFNANCVLIPWKAFYEVEVIDNIYIHSLGDFDYGLSLKKAGWSIYTSDFYVGVCNRNSTKGVWTDVLLSRKERLKKKEQPKGLPFKQWFHYINKNFGFCQAIWHSITPYIKILLGYEV